MPMPMMSPNPIPGGFLQAAMAAQQAPMPTPNSAAKGRHGDTVVAHMTPGEIAIPPQLQTPKVLAILQQEFQRQGVDPQQFTAGSPQSSVNPATGMPEYNMLSAFLPIALSLAGSAIAPGIGTALGSTMSSSLLGAIGGGAGSALGGLLTGQKPMKALLGGLGAGAGGYMLGTLGAGKTLFGEEVAKAAAAAPAAQAGANVVPAAEAFSAGNPAGAAASALPPADSWKNMWGALPQNMNMPGMIGSTMGGMLGASLAGDSSKKSAGPAYPPGFMDKMAPVSELPSWQQMLGQNTYRGPRPNFTDFNPATNFPAAHNFYPA